MQQSRAQLELAAPDWYHKSRTEKTIQDTGHSNKHLSSADYMLIHANHASGLYRRDC